MIGPPTLTHLLARERSTTASTLVEEGEEAI
jgi:hypothetical protein